MNFNQRKLASFASIIAMSTMLSACGEGGGGVNSTPAAPTFTYKTIDQQTGNQNYSTAGIHYDGLALGTTKTYKFGGGVTIGYEASTDKYTLTSPEGYSVQITNSDIDRAQSTANTTIYKKLSGTITDVVYLTRANSKLNPSVLMSYTLLGRWGHFDSSLSVFSTGYRSDYAVGGIPTQAGDVPKSGSANYDVGIFGTSQYSNGPGNTKSLRLDPNSTASLSINFATGAVDTTVNLNGVSTIPGDSAAIIPVGTFTGSGTLDSGGPGYSGTFAATTSSGFAGSLFGPQGIETAYAWFIKSALVAADGIVYGTKK